MNNIIVEDKRQHVNCKNPGKHDLWTETCGHRPEIPGQRKLKVYTCVPVDLSKVYHPERTNTFPSFTLAYEKEKGKKTLFNTKKKKKQFRNNNNESNNNLEIKAA